MICRFCGEDRRPVKAHVISEAFFRRLRQGQDPPRILVNKKGEHPKRAPVGVYDRQILCAICESRFGDWDDYAQKILKETPENASTVMYDSQIVGYAINDYNYDMLKLFFVSMLWRASVSVQPFFQRINLGPYETAAKSLIEFRDPGPANDFSVTLAKFDHPFGATILDPHPERWSNVNYCRFYLGGYVAYIKVDRRKAPEPHLYFCLKPGEPLRIIARDLEQSHELRLIKKIAAANQTLNRSGGKRRTPPV